jgi:HK97 family phage portal protein
VKALIAPRRAIKAGIDQEAMGQVPSGLYRPLNNLQTWTYHYATAGDAALNVATVLTCVRILSESFASVPLILYRRLPGGGKERAVDHPLYPVLHDQPNPDMTSFAWRELLMSHLATWGNGYSEIAFDVLGRMQLWPIRPDRIIPWYDLDGRKQYDYVSSAGARRTLRPGSLFHVAGLSSTGLEGYSPIALLRSSLGLLRTAETFGQTLFDNNARPATVLQHPKTVSKDAQERLTAQVDELKGARNAGKTILLEEGLSVHEIGFPPEDAEFMATRTFQKREILAAYRIPPHKAGDLERATFSNIEQQSIEFVQDTMLPWFTRTEQEISTQLLAEDERDEYFAEFLVDGLLRGDAVARATALSIRWQHGTMNADQWREMENENPLPDGIGQTYYVPANYVPAAGPAAPALPQPQVIPGPADLTGSPAPSDVAA